MNSKQLTFVVREAKQHDWSRAQVERFLRQAFPHGPEGSGEWTEQQFDDVWRLIKDGG